MLEANKIVAVALLCGMPFFVVCGALSDKIGRKRVMMAGCLLAVVCYYPIYRGLVYYAGSNIVAVDGSNRDNATGQTKLAAMTPDPATGQLVPAKEAANPNVVMLGLLIFAQILFVCLVYGPIAAYLVEAFPAKIRYTSLSLPYHIGNGIFGGLLPLIGVWACAATGNIYAGLVYPITIATITLIVGSLMLPETRHVKIWEEVK